MRDEFVRMLYERYFEMVKKYCLPKLRFDEEAAADCAHAVFDKAGEQYEKLKDHPNVTGWLIVTAKHLVHKRWTKNVRDAAGSIPLELASAIPDRSDPFDAVELSDEEIRRITGAVLSGLDEREMSFYTLLYVDKLSFREIGERLGVSEKAARAKLSRITMKLKKRIIYFLNE